MSVKVPIILYLIQIGRDMSVGANQKLFIAYRATYF